MRISDWSSDVCSSDLEKRVSWSDGWMEDVMGSLNDLSAQEIGRRLRLAREAAGIRQEEAAQIIGMSRPKLVSIEQGVRPVRPNELQMLAHRYGVSVTGLLCRDDVSTDLLPRFRNLRDTEGHSHAEGSEERRVGK